MRNIDLVNDLGAPLAVTAANLVIRSTKPTWEEYAAYAITGLGYLATFMGWGGQFVKNAGIAEFPIAAEKLYDRIRGAVPAASRVNRPVMTRSIRQTPQPGFENVRPLY